MKKLILTLAVVGIAAASYGQGSVNFGNRVAFTTSPTTYRPVYGTDWNGVNGVGATGLTANAPAGSAYKAQLWMAIGASQAEGTLLPITATAARNFLTGSNAGYWSGENPKSLITAAGQVNAGGTATLQVRVWDSTAADYDAALAAGKATGKSLTFNYTVTTSGTPAPAEFFMEGFQSFGLVIVPEPTTYALGMLGLGLAWIIRRKK